MAFAQNLEKCFHILTQGRVYTEEELRIKLEDALLLCNKSSWVDHDITVLHMDRGSVEFQVRHDWVSSNAIGSRVQSSLGDRLFVIYSKERGICRIFIMKNRAKKNREFPNRFYTNMLQLDLLSSGGTFTMVEEGKSWKEMNETILQSAEVLSIAVYGVFYQDGDGYDMKVYSANKVMPMQLEGIELWRTAVFRGGLNQRRVNSPNWLEDYEGLSSVRNFGRAIEELMLGQPISAQWKKGFEEYMAAKLKQSLPETFMTMEIRSSAGDLERKENTSYEWLNGLDSVVFINVDER